MDKLWNIFVYFQSRRLGDIQFSEYFQTAQRERGEYSQEFLKTIMNSFCKCCVHESQSESFIVYFRRTSLFSQKWGCLWSSALVYTHTPPYFLHTHPGQIRISLIAAAYCFRYTQTHTPSTSLIEAAYFPGTHARAYLFKTISRPLTPFLVTWQSPTLP